MSFCDRLPYIALFVLQNGVGFFADFLEDKVGLSAYVMLQPAKYN